VKLWTNVNYSTSACAIFWLILHIAENIDLIRQKNSNTTKNYTECYRNLAVVWQNSKMLRTEAEPPAKLWPISWHNYLQKLPKNIGFISSMSFLIAAQDNSVRVCKFAHSLEQWVNRLQRKTLHICISRRFCTYCNKTEKNSIELMQHITTKHSATL